MLPKTTARWVLQGTDGIDSLCYEDEAVIPALGDHDVLVEMHAASLNYRELVVTKGGSGPVTPNIIPSSDGAGIILAIGSAVVDFKAGDKVVTHLAPYIPDHQWPTFAEITTGLGQQVDGTLCSYGVFPQSALVTMPSNCSFEQAATLTCSALTAWNCLFGLHGQPLKEGDWLLTQGTGGVSIAAIQFATAIGANVVATTSSDEKAQRLLSLGVKHVIDYKKNPAWGEAAKAFTPDTRGFDYIVDVGGDSTLGQSVKSIRMNGVVVVTGFLGGVGSEKTSLVDAIWNLCIVRGVLLGTRDMFRSMTRFIEAHAVDLVLDDQVFQFKDTVLAYKRLEAQKHFAKIVILTR